MLSKTRTRPVDSPAPGMIPETITGTAGSGLGVGREPELIPAQTPGGKPHAGEETRGSRFRRKAHRTRLHGYAIATVALVAYLIALAVSNTAHVKVGWVFGTSHVGLVWLVLFSAILGWLLGLATSARFRWRTRTPRRQAAKS